MRTIGIGLISISVYLTVNMILQQPINWPYVCGIIGTTIIFAVADYLKNRK